MPYLIRDKAEDSRIQTKKIIGLKPVNDFPWLYYFPWLVLKYGICPGIFQCLSVPVQVMPATT